MEFIKKTKNNIDVNIIKTTKFKTTRIQVVFVSKLDEKTLTARALMPYIIKSVSKKYPSRDVLSSYLEEMYSASFNVGVNKITDAHIITFDMNFIDNYYTFGNEDLFNKAIEFIKELLFSPLFDKDIFIEEKRLMEEYFEGIYSNKTKYAFNELKEVMFKDDTFRLSPLGSSDMINDVTLEDVKDEYRKMINTDKVFFSVVGNIDEEVVMSKLDKAFNIGPHPDYPKLIDDSSYVVSKPRYIEHYIDINQAKLVCGYRLDVLYNTKYYYAALVFNLLFGGTSESLLFREIREKSSLVYFINSNYNPYKGVLFVFAGINEKDYDTVMEKTSAIIEDIKKEQISEDTLEITKKLLLNSIIQGMDSNHSLIGKINQSYIFDFDYSLDKTIEHINSITLSDLAIVANKLKLDTTYLLRGDEHEKN